MNPNVLCQIGNNTNVARNELVWDVVIDAMHDTAFIHGGSSEEDEPR